MTVDQLAQTPSCQHPLVEADLGGGQLDSGGRGFASVREAGIPREERYALGKGMRKKVPRSTRRLMALTAQKPSK